MTEAPGGIRFNREGAAPGPIVAGFSGRGFRIDGVVLEGALLTPMWARAWDGRLDEAALADMLAITPEFLLLGTGPEMVRPAPHLVDAIEARGIGIEAMDSRAAARAWGVLRGEGRWIAAALMPL